MTQLQFYPKKMENIKWLILRIKNTKFRHIESVPQAVQNDRPFRYHNALCLASDKPRPAKIFGIR